MKKTLFLTLILALSSCGKKTQDTAPINENVTPLSNTAPVVVRSTQLSGCPELAGEYLCQRVDLKARRRNRRRKKILSITENSQTGSINLKVLRRNGRVQAHSFLGALQNFDIFLGRDNSRTGRNSTDSFTYNASCKSNDRFVFKGESSYYSEYEKLVLVKKPNNTVIIRTEEWGYDRRYSVKKRFKCKLASQF